MRTRASQVGRATPILRVDPVACEGVGICSHLAPDVVTVDSWGYPIITERDLHGRDLAQAERAVSGCPRRAMFLDRRQV